VDRVAPPDGYSRGLVEPEARSVQEISHDGRRVTFSWFDPPFRPEPPHTNQAYGICLTEGGMIVLGACDIDGERYRNLLGGGIEPGETLEDCLVREVMEEGCARVVESRYIGCQRVDDPDHPTGPWRYYQSRFWARVELLPWDPQHEIDERLLVRPEQFLQTLSWGSAAGAAIILTEALRCEAPHAPVVSAMPSASSTRFLIVRYCSAQRLGSPAGRCTTRGGC
jgi:hypothetical protein